MAKKLVTKEEIVTEDFEPRSSLDQIAFGVVKTGKKLYNVYSVKYNTKTKEAGEVTVLTGDVDFYEAQHQFRTLVIKSGILS